MDNITRMNIIDKLREYNHKPLVYGKLDCNLVVLEIFEPEKYEIMVGSYKTVIGGARVANKTFGYTRLDDFMEESDDYSRVAANFVQFGDIIFSDVDRVAMIALSTTTAFAINPTSNTFVECNISIPDSYRIYRRI